MSQHKCVGFTLFGLRHIFCGAANYGARMLAPRRRPSLFEQLLKQDFEIQNVLFGETTPWMNRQRRVPRNIAAAAGFSTASWTQSATHDRAAATIAARARREHDHSRHCAVVLGALPVNRSL
jgi:hypothetical protein